MIVHRPVARDVTMQQRQRPSDVRIAQAGQPPGLITAEQGERIASALVGLR